MAEHTPGPWTVDPRSLHVSASDSKGYMRIADVRGWGHLTGKGHGAWGYAEDMAIGIQEANARLIAAAPDMLAALKKARVAVMVWSPSPHEPLQEIEDAIAKAEGAERDMEAAR